MKVPFPLFAALPVTLLDVLSVGHTIERAVESQTKLHRQWGSRDRRFFNETIYELIRHYRKYWVLAGIARDQYDQTSALNIQNMQKLLMAYFEFHFPELKTPYPQELSKVDVKLTPAEETSFPDWLYDLGMTETHPERWPCLAKTLNQPANVYLRTNTLKTSRRELIKKLQAEDLEVESINDSHVAIHLKVRKNILKTNSYLSGEFEVQDLSSQKVAELLAPKPGEKIVDACAGGGGKSLHLASLMENQGKLLSMDIHQKKLDNLQERVRRAGVNIIETRLIDSPKVITKIEKTADALLLDVPCTGSGVIRRNPSSKWSLKQKDWIQLLETQSQILHNYSAIVKPGGRMVYATCSLFSSENEKAVSQFLNQHSDWTVESQNTIWPDQQEGDGFFMTKLNRMSR